MRRESWLSGYQLSHNDFRHVIRICASITQQGNVWWCSVSGKVTTSMVDCNDSQSLYLWQGCLQADWLPRDQEWLWLRWLQNKRQCCLPLSLGSNITVTISGTDCTDLRRDGQAELVSVKQDVFQNRPWLICEKSTVVDSTWFESVTARLTAMNREIRSAVQCQVFDSTNHYKHYCWVCRMETEV